MKFLFCFAIAAILGGCVYAEGPDGRFASIDLPVHNQTTVNKTVTVNAPPGTTVIINDNPPPLIIERGHRLRVRCYDEYGRRSGCHR